MSLLPALLLLCAARAESLADPWAGSVAPEVTPRPAPPDTGLSFLGIFDTKVSVNNLATTTPLVNGQVVGTLGGLNATTVQKPAGMFAEERAIGFLRYAPPLLDGRATLTAGFEVDFAFGDTAYATGGNTGGGYGGDQVNLQTKRLHARFNLGHESDVVVGLQFVGDGVADPERAVLDDLARSGGRLNFFGSEAAGVSVYGRVYNDTLRYRVGGYTLAENAFAEPDDITLWMGDTQIRPAYATTAGLHLWYLRDRAGGTSGAFGSGPTSPLSELQGGPRLDLRANDTDAAPETSAALAWIVADGGYNAGLTYGRYGVSAVAALNVGRLYVTSLPDVNVAGWLADVEGRVRWAPGQGSVLRAEALLTSGDDDRESYNGIITGNSYGVAGAANVTHGCLLLFPDPMSINRQVAMVYDVSGAGGGLVGVTGQAGYDVIPNKLTTTLGGGHARTAAGDLVGTEVNARVLTRPLPLVTVGLYGGMLLGTTFEVAPWSTYLALDWVLI